MPFRVMMGLASGTDVALSIAILIITILFIAKVAIKIYSNAIWISARLDKENMWTGFRFEEWGEIVLEYRNFNNVYCEVVVGKDKFYLMRRPHMKGITNPAGFDYTEDCMEVLNEELDKCKKLC